MSQLCPVSSEDRVPSCSLLSSQLRVETSALDGTPCQTKGPSLPVVTDALIENTPLFQGRTPLPPLGSSVSTNSSLLSNIQFFEEYLSQYHLASLLLLAKVCTQTIWYPILWNRSPVFSVFLKFSYFAGMFRFGWFRERCTFFSAANSSIFLNIKTVLFSLYISILFIFHRHYSHLQKQHF